MDGGAPSSKEIAVIVQLLPRIGSETFRGPPTGERFVVVEIVMAIQGDLSANRGAHQVIGITTAIQCEHGLRRVNGANK